MRVAAGVPLLVSLVWLPLKGGGSDPGALVIAEGTSFVAVAALALSGRLRAPGNGLRWIFAALGLLLAAAIISTSSSRDLDASVPLLVQWFWIAAVALLFVTLSDGWRRTVPVVGAALVAALLLQTFWGFFVWWGGGDVGPAQSGTFFAPNQYAGYIVLLAPLLVAAALTRPARPEAAAWGFLAVFAYLGVVLSGSRAGMGAALMGVLVVVVLVARRHLSRTLARLALLAVGMITASLLVSGSLLFPGEALPRSSGVLSGVEAKGGNEAASLEMRLQWAEGAVRIGARRPLAGSGLGTYGDMLVQVQDEDWHWSRYAHNQFLEAFAEGGVLLLAGTLLLPLSALWVARRGLLTKTPLETPWAFGLAGGLIGASAHLVVDHDWSFPAYAITYVMVALLLAASATLDDPSAIGRPISAPTRFVCAAAALALLAVVGGQGYGLAQARTQATDAAAEPSKHRMWLRLSPFATLPRQLLARDLASHRDATDLEAAAGMLRSAIRLDELEPRLRWQLADVYLKQGKIEGAIRETGAAIRIAPNAPAAYARASLVELQQAARPAPAAGILDRGISRLKRQPDRRRLASSIAQLLLLRSVVEERMSGPEPALSFARQAADLDPKSPEPWLRIAFLVCNDGSASAALARAEAEGATLEQLDEVRRLRGDRCR